MLVDLHQRGFALSGRSDDIILQYAQTEIQQDCHVMDTIGKNILFEVAHAFPVAEAALYNALLDAATLKHIWGVSSITVDPRPGGHARATFTIENERWDFTITYQELVPHSKLRWVVHFDRFPNKEILVTLSFRPGAGGSELTVRMENLESAQERDDNRQAWERALNRLEAIVGNRQ